MVHVAPRAAAVLHPEEERRRGGEEERRRAFLTGGRGDGAGHHPVTHGNAISCSGRSRVSRCVWIGWEQVF
ncbi:hypothetical protein CgunFtcFv8_025540 [Champsocephalus gunnari]|uniref:Uncharacterized protein n=1 Tax=Champsocephalus gunnari TaxID=52237 RepID=A0AAN8H3F1_CHAGU|nr:hypothetical protein CgunFtcFv8_025540 [Champsocephalus gunnari]